MLPPTSPSVDFDRCCRLGHTIAVFASEQEAVEYGLEEKTRIVFVEAFKLGVLRIDCCFTCERAWTQLVLNLTKPMDSIHITVKCDADPNAAT